MATGSGSGKTAIVGRDAEIARLDEALARAAAGAGGFVVLLGPAGIGKSRLIDETLQRARSQGMRTASTANYAHVRAPFGPFADLLRDLRNAAPIVVPRGSADRRLFDRLLGDADDATQPADWEKRRLFVLIAEALERGAAERPVVVAIDDLQWADPESIEVLQYLGARIERVPVLIVAGIRDEDDASAHDLSASILRLNSASALELTALGEPAARSLIALGAGRLAARTVDSIVRRGDGNPLFILELLRGVDKDNADTQLPSSIQQTTHARIARLSSADAQIVEIAAVWGRVFTLANLVDISGAEEPLVLQTIRHARDNGLFDEASDARDTFTFRHELIRAAIYDRMLLAERERIHRRIAERLSDGDAPAVVLAYHWNGAGDAKSAALYAVRAGDEAASINAHASARDHYEDALRSEAWSEEERARIGEKLAREYSLLGDARSALEHIARAAEVLGALDAGEGLRLHLEMSHSAYRCGDADAAIRACEHVLSHEYATIEQRFNAEVLLATYCVHDSDAEGAQRHIERADATTGEREPIYELRLEWARAMTAHLQDDPGCLDPAQTALAIAQRYATPSILTYTLMNVAAMAREHGRADLANPLRAEAIETADRNGLTLASVFARRGLIEDHYFHGRLREAYALVVEAASLQVDASIARISIAEVALPVLFELDLVDALPALSDSRLVEEALTAKEAARSATLLAAHVQLAAARGDVAGIRELVERALANIMSPHYLAWALHTFAVHGDAAQVERIRDLFRGRTVLGPARAYATSIEAIGARSQGTAVEADQAARQAISIAREMDAPFLEALGEELLGHKREAFAIYERIGAIAERRRLKGKEKQTLSPRETQIAKLVASGMSNRSIAEQLVLSERTVEHHVASLYAKLGVGSRTEFLVMATSTAIIDG